MSRLLPLVLLVAVLTGACSAAPAEEPTVDPDAVQQVHARMADVAAAQREADRRLAAAVEAVRQLDGIISGLRDPARVDDAKGTWPRVESAWNGASSEGLREGLVDLAQAVDEARIALDRVRDEVRTEPWLVDYLAAEDEVLIRTRSYAETADRLAQALVHHWPTYADLHDRTARFVEQRWFYRTSQEAADAYELAVQPLLGELAAGQEAIASAREERDAAAHEVNEAVAAAREAWEAREEPSAPAPG